MTDDVFSAEAQKLVERIRNTKTEDFLELLRIIGLDSKKELSGQDLNGLDLSSVDLSDCNLTRANFSNANLSNANLSGADLSQANLSNANLSGANLSQANLSNANLSGANLSQANLSNANLSGADLNQANLQSTIGLTFTEKDENEQLQEWNLADTTKRFLLEVRAIVVDWFRRPAISLLFLMLISSMAGARVAFAIRDSSEARLARELEKLEDENDGLRIKLEGIGAASIPTVEWDIPADQKLYEWGASLPVDIISILEERNQTSDNIVSAISDKEGGNLNLELRIKEGDSLSPRDITEYDFICNDRSSDDVASCKQWQLDEIEELSSFGEIENPVVIERVQAECNNSWQVVQVEKSTRYDAGEISENPVYEVTCLFEGESGWKSYELSITPQGDIIKSSKIVD